MSYDDDLMHGDRQMIVTFGRPVKLPGKGKGEGNTVLAVFDDPYTRTDLPEGGFVRGRVITLTLITTDATGLSSRDVVNVPQRRVVTPEGGIAWEEWVDYTVREPQPDGAGLTVVYLDPITDSDNNEHGIY
ncbi:head-tail joining protein [Kluyvera intermedia]|uniref:head-tail joining protein n=1 Tax=Kluyvera intermedia TaxID=61648 RepID=UPI0035254425